MSAEWNVLVHNINTNKICRYNILRYGFLSDVVKGYAKHIVKEKDESAFRNAVRLSLFYYFGSKCEWEVLVRGWPPSIDGKEEIKIDVYEQVMMNFDAFMQYITTHIKELRKEYREERKR